MTSRGLQRTLPTDPAQRIHTLDILRGFALLGMFVVHFHVNSTDPGGFDEAVRLFVWRLVETKSHGTFALLFGAGFAIQHVEHPGLSGLQYYIDPAATAYDRGERGW